MRVRVLATIVLTLALAGAVHAQEEPVHVDMDDVEWTEIVPGVAFGAVYGDFTQELHGKLVRFAPGLESPPHTHTHAYHGVVISGTVTNPYKGEADPPRMGSGDYWYVPGGVEHVTACVSEEPCLFWTYGDDAWDIAIVEWE